MAFLEANDRRERQVPIRSPQVSQRPYEAIEHLVPSKTLERFAATVLAAQNVPLLDAGVSR